jgi:hypothetical protein
MIYLWYTWRYSEVWLLVRLWDVSTSRLFVYAQHGSFNEYIHQVDNLLSVSESKDVHVVWQEDKSSTMNNILRWKQRNIFIYEVRCNDMFVDQANNSH